ncbi:spore germination protein (amino acid permease) [Evansella vedderi]|uniref:Spore germination protein (Amino acid permease) n=1 Tax=Evansella vedderi TaxID=38282 RepID=A0ABT9ZYG2_9BACI|nr:GerAB/ArcD/ProY family transporter [Evansella vedderi]MDQ0255731.1 spore germination protein (amino acid permease) [Evansella vedderi]
MNIQSPYTRIGGVELFTFTYCSAVTIGFIFLPYISSEEIRSAWLKVIVAVIPYLLFIYLYKKVVTKHNDRDVLHLFKDMTSPWIYYFVITYLFASTIYSIFFGTKGLIIIVQTYLMQDTPQWTIGMFFLLVIGLSASYGIHAITRMIVIIFFHEIILFISLVLFIFSDDFKWINIPPFLTVDIGTFLVSSISEVTRYGGIIALFAYLPFVDKKVKVFRPITLSVIFIMFTYFLICLVTLGVFGFDQALTMLSPVTALMQTTTSPTGLFERLDLFFLTVWVMSFFKIGLIFVWFSSMLLKEIIPLKVKNYWVQIWIIITISTLIVISTPSIVNLDWRPYNINMLSYTLFVPVMMFLYLLIRKKQGVGQNENKSQ